MSLGGGGGESAPAPAVVVPTYTIYYETGMHILSMGLGKSLNNIYKQGKNILVSPITRLTTPSGSTVTAAGTEGSFKIYWGEASQGIDANLASLTGVQSSYPHTFYLVWRKRLGTQAQWPQLEYDIEVEHPADLALPTNGAYLKGYNSSGTFSALVLSPTSIDTTGYSSILNTEATSNFAVETSSSNVRNLKPGSTVSRDSIGYSGDVINVLYNSSTSKYLVMLNKSFSVSSHTNTYTFSYEGLEYSGVNPASALYQLLFAGSPHGLDMDKSLFNMSDFDDLADRFKNTEPSPCSLYLKSGKSFKDGIGMLMQDFGIVFYKDTVTGKYGFTAIREGGTPTDISADDYVNMELAQVFAYSVLNPDKIVYSFKDLSRKFSDATIVVTDDAGAQYSGNPNTKKVQLNTITDFATASRVSSRREQESMVDEILTVDISENYLDIKPGELCTLEDFDGLFRFMEKKVGVDSAQIQASFARDLYSITNDYEEITSAGFPAILTIDPSEDLALSVVEANRSIARDANFLFVLRIRDSQYIVSSEIRHSADDLSYTSAGTASYSTGGTLTSALGITTTLKETGVFIDMLGEDFTDEDISDLSTDAALWRSGYQLAIIGTEICFLEGLDVGTGELLGLMRARFGTRMQEHAIGTPVYIVKQTKLVPMTTTYLTAGADVYIRSLPYTATGLFPIGDATPVHITSQGGGFRPLPCENLFTDDGTNAYVTGSDIALRWSYKNATDTGAAGIGLSGEASAPVDPEGTFLLQILNGTTVVRSVEQAGATYTYTNADLVTDFSGEPASFNVRVVEVLNGLTSETETATITKV